MMSLVDQYQIKAASYIDYPPEAYLQDWQLNLNRRWYQDPHILSVMDAQSHHWKLYPCNHVMLLRSTERYKVRLSDMYAIEYSRLTHYHLQNSNSIHL